MINFNDDYKLTVLNINLPENYKYIDLSVDHSILIEGFIDIDRDKQQNAVEKRINDKIKEVIVTDEKLNEQIVEGDELLIIIETPMANMLNAICLNKKRNYTTPKGKISYKINFTNFANEENLSYDFQINVENTMIQNRKEDQYIITELNVKNFFDLNYDKINIADILDDNVRLPLGKVEQKKNFIASILGGPEFFFLKNNGITGSFKIHHDMSTHLKIEEFKILNGGQTFSTLMNIYELIYLQSYKNLSLAAKNIFDYQTLLGFDSDSYKIHLSHEELKKLLKSDKLSIELNELIISKLESNFSYVDVFNSVITKFIAEIKEYGEESQFLEDEQMFKTLVNYIYVKNNFYKVTVGLKLFSRPENDELLNEITYSLNNQTAVKSADKWTNDEFVSSFNKMEHNSIQIAKRSGRKSINDVYLEEVVEQIFLLLSMPGEAKTNSSKNVERFFNKTSEILNEENVGALTNKEYKLELAPKDIIDEKFVTLVNLGIDLRKNFDSVFRDIDSTNLHEESVDTIRKYGKQVVEVAYFKNYESIVYDQVLYKKCIEKVIDRHSKITEDETEQNKFDNNFFKVTSNCLLLVEEE